MKEPGGLQFMGGHKKSDTTERLSTHTLMLLLLFIWSAFLTRRALDRAGSFPTRLVLKAVGCGLGSLHSGMGGPQAQSLQPSHLGPGTPLQTEAYVDTAFACCQSSLSP